MCFWQLDLGEPAEARLGAEEQWGVSHNLEVAPPAPMWLLVASHVSEEREPAGPGSPSARAGPPHLLRSPTPQTLP